MYTITGTSKNSFLIARSLVRLLTTTAKAAPIQSSSSRGSQSQSRSRSRPGVTPASGPPPRSPPKPAPTPTPTSAASVFGLEENDVENFVKGLYVEGGGPVPKVRKESVEDVPSRKLQWPPPPPQGQEGQKQEASANAKGVDPETDGKMDIEDKYSKWFSYRVPGPEEAQQVKEDKDLEKVRYASFGVIRLDSDNPVQEDPDQDFEEKPEDYPDYKLQRRQAEEPWRSARSAEVNDEEIFDPRSQPRRPKVLPEWAQQQQQEHEQQQRPGIRFKMPQVVTKPGVEAAADVPEKTEKGESNAKEKSKSKTKVLKKDQDDDDPNVKIGMGRIPPVYRLPEYNDITHQDMWHLLSKQIIFDNDFLVAINKPPGVPIHSPSVTCRHTVIDFLDDLARLTKCEKVYPLHRLDKETTGVLLFAKTEAAAAIIKQKFAQREITKKYLGIIKNCPEMEQGTIQIPIAEGEIRKSSVFRATLRPDLTKYNLKTDTTNATMATTHFKIIASNPHCAFVELTPETGVKHQIRVHLGFGIGCPIIGDHKYSHRDKMAPQRLTPAILKKIKVEQSKVRYLPLHLHASNVSFAMPESFSTSSIFVHARPPMYFMRTLRSLGLK